MDLSGRVMLATLNIRTFTGKKVDNGASEEVAKNHNTTVEDAGQFTKHIISRGALKELKATAGQARAFHYARTLPWTDAGGRILSGKGFFPYTEGMRILRQNYEEQVRDFIRIYPRLIEEQRQLINGLFNPDDYPSISELANRFEFVVDLAPLPSTKTWFMDELNQEMAALRAAHDEKTEARIGEAVFHTYSKVLDVVRKMAVKLSEYEKDESGKVVKGKFRDSLVENVREIADLLPTLNITNDPGLTAIHAKLLELTRHDGDALRADPVFRKNTATAAQSLVDEIVSLGVI